MSKHSADRGQDVYELTHLCRIELIKYVERNKISIMLHQQIAGIHQLYLGGIPVAVKCAVLDTTIKAEGRITDKSHASTAADHIWQESKTSTL